MCEEMFTRHNMKCFENDASAFLRTHKSNESTYLASLFRTLKDDSIPENRKVGLLHVLQSGMEMFCQSSNCIDRLVAFLPNYYFGLLESKQKISLLLQSEVLVSWTTFLLSIDEFTSDKMRQSFVTLFDELNQIILNINNVDNCVLRWVAADCLLEMELEYPGLLNRMLETLRDLFLRETTYVHQKYALLLSFACKRYFTHKPDPFDETSVMLSEILMRRSNVQTLLTSPTLQMVREKQTVCCLLEHLSSTSPHIASTIVRNAADIILASDSVPSSVLKGVVLKYKQTFDISFLYSLCYLQSKFGRDLFTDVEEQQLLIHLFNLSRFPLLSSEEKLLCLDWILHYATERRSNAGNVEKMQLDSSFAIKFSPSIFDNCSISLKKYLLMTTLFSSDADKKEHFRVLAACFLSSAEVVRWSMNRRWAVGLFQILFIFLKFFPDSFCSNFTNFINDFVICHPNFSSVVLNFLDHVQTCFPKLSQDLWKSTVSFLIQSSINPESFPDYSVLLNEATKHSPNICQPKNIILFIQSLLSSKCFEPSWNVGNQILEICRNLIKHQNSDLFFSDMCCLLHETFTNNENIDIRDSFRLLYVILTNLSWKKINSALNYSVPETYRSNLMSSLDSDTSSFGIASRIIFLNRSPIELIRSDSRFVFKNTTSHDSCEPFPLNILQFYFSFIESDEFLAEVKILCSLQFSEQKMDDSSFDKLYAVHLTCESSLNIAIDDITIPRLICPGTCNVEVKLRPRDFISIELPFSATFNTADTRTFTCRLCPIVVKFADYFLPFGVPDSFSSRRQEYRRYLFNHLWDEFDQSANRGGSLNNFVRSVHSLNVTSDHFRSRLIERFNPFLIEPDVDDPQTQCQVGIFLPRRYHILIKFELGSSNCVARILVDHSTLLAPLNQYLLSLED